MDRNTPPPIPGWGADADFARRPGVPMELEPRVREGAHWQEPERMGPPPVAVFKRQELEELTPVYSTAMPPKGLSGLMRRWAYTHPETHVRHWALLLFADRVDVLEARLSRAGGPLLVLGLLGAAGAAALTLRRR